MRLKAVFCSAHISENKVVVPGDLIPGTTNDAANDSPRRIPGKRSGYAYIAVMLQDIGSWDGGVSA